MGLTSPIVKIPDVALTAALGDCLSDNADASISANHRGYLRQQSIPEPWEMYNVLLDCHLALVAGQDTRHQYELQNLDQTITLIVVLEGAIKLGKRGQPVCIMPEGHVTLVMPCEKSLEIEFCEGNQHVAMFLDLGTRFLNTVLNQEELSRLSTQLSNTHGVQQPLLNLSLPLTKTIYDIVYNLIQSPRTARFRQMLVESRANELVATILQDLLSYTQFIGETDMPVEVIRSIQKAHQIVIENFASPPTLNQLSRRVGVNRNKLSRGFKMLYGATVFEYCHNYRMKLAQTLLQKSRHSIAYVAELTGYEHPGNFTTAYKRHYGELPKEARLSS